MEDILASIRRILNEDEVTASGQMTADTALPPPPAEDDVLVLDNSMMIGAVPGPEPTQPPAPKSSTPEAMVMNEPVTSPHLLAPESEAAAAASVGSLLRTLTAERSTEVHRGGPTIEDLVREGIRPMLKSWLDVHLPPLVERLVRAEIERISGRAPL